MKSGEGYISVGASLRADADKMLHRSLLFAVILVMAHLLDVRPSEIDAGGLKIAFRDASVIYGGLSLIFGYYLSRAGSLSEQSISLLPWHTEPYRMRANMRMARRLSKGKITPKKMKSEARSTIAMSNVLLFPYRLLSVLFVLTAICFAVFDIYNLGIYMINNSGFLAKAWKIISV